MDKFEPIRVMVIEYTKKLYWEDRETYLSICELPFVEKLDYMVADKKKKYEEYKKMYG